MQGTMAAIKLSLLALCVVLPTIDATRASLLADTCEYNTYLCCWTKNDNGVQDNTDVCAPAPRRGDRRLRGSDSSGGMVSHESTMMMDMDDDEGDSESEFVDYAGGDEGDVHCHGFVWADGAHLESFILPLYKYVRNFDHRDARGYYGRYDRSYPSAPRC